MTFYDILSDVNFWFDAVLIVAYGLVCYSLGVLRNKL